MKHSLHSIYLFASGSSWYTYIVMRIRRDNDIYDVEEIKLISAASDALAHPLRVELFRFIYTENIARRQVCNKDLVERFGLAQLHQLRGRIGRGTEKSYCILLNRGNSKIAEERTQIMVDSRDGFYIAEEDLKLRGPGGLFGERQSGALGFVLADIYEDASIMKKAAAYVDEVLAADPGFEIPRMRQLDVRSI